ncbi:MAG: glycerate-2-kinase family protein, partial [Chloroflexota bacterium]|nr:glycerate-2-kinase family protein [Chloroflexota bacterium]
MKSPRDLILEAYQQALRSVDPEEAARKALSPNPGGRLIVDGRDFGNPDRVNVIAVGKAAVPMMAGAIAALGESVHRGFVITKDGHIDRQLPSHVEIHEAAHPVLDERSVAATQRLLEWVTRIPVEAVAICLISGGGSALLEAPVEGVSLADFQNMTRQLLRAGADIHKLNAVRSRVSRVKGGGLRTAIPARQVITLALSDVLGNDPGVIASGPTVPSKSTGEDALRV